MEVKCTFFFPLLPFQPWTDGLSRLKLDEMTAFVFWSGVSLFWMVYSDAATALVGLREVHCTWLFLAAEQLKQKWKQSSRASSHLGAFLCSPFFQTCVLYEASISWTTLWKSLLPASAVLHWNPLFLLNQKELRMFCQCQPHLVSPEIEQ